MSLFDKENHINTVGLDVQTQLGQWCHVNAAIYYVKGKPAVVFKQIAGLISITNCLEDVIKQFNKDYKGFIGTPKLNKSWDKVRIFQLDDDGLFEIDYEVKNTGFRAVGMEIIVKINKWIPVTQAYEVLYL